MSGYSNELAAGPGGCGQGVEPAAVPRAGSEAAAETELKSAISLSSTSCQQSAQSTIFASTRRNAGLGQREQSMSSPDESAGEKKDAEQNGDAAKNEKEKAHRDYVARRLADCRCVRTEGIVKDGTLIPVGNAVVFPASCVLRLVETAQEFARRVSLMEMGTAQAH